MIKSYTDLEQSKKLTEILPLESADMGYLWNGYSFGEYPVSKQTVFKRIENIPCWSLAALLGLLPKLHKLQHSENGYYCSLANYKYVTEAYNNPIDACVAMVEKLHELKML